MKIPRLAAALLVLVAVHAAAADTPQRLPPVTLVVPYASGGPTDMIGRALATELATTLKRKVVVRNIGGAGSTIGAEQVSRAKPDGRTLLLANIGLATGVSLYPKLRYDPVADFQPIGLVAEVPMTLVARPNLPIDDLSAVLARAREGADKLSIGHAGIGSASHLCTLMLMRATERAFTSVPYQGTAPAMRDVSAGHVDLLCDQTSHTLPHIRARDVKVLGVSSAKRLAALPQVPTLAEAGLPRFELTIWHGLFAPRGTPAETVSELGTALQAALESPRLKTAMNRVEARPASPAQARPEALGTRLAAEIERWRPVIEKAGTYAN